LWPDQCCAGEAPVNAQHASNVKAAFVAWHASGVSFLFSAALRRLRAPLSAQLAMIGNTLSIPDELAQSNDTVFGVCLRPRDRPAAQRPVPRHPTVSNTHTPGEWIQYTLQACKHVETLNDNDTGIVAHTHKTRHIYADTTHRHTDMQRQTHAQTRTDTATHRPKDQQTHRHTDTQTHRHTDTQTHKHTDTNIHRHTGTQAHRHTGTQEHRDTGTQGHRDTGTQGHRDTETQRHRDTETEKQTHTHTQTQTQRCRDTPGDAPGDAHGHAYTQRRTQ